MIWDLYQWKKKTLMGLLFLAEPSFFKRGLYLVAINFLFSNNENKEYLMFGK